MSENADPPAEQGYHTLPVGTVVGGLEIVGVIGEGGFGIVYLAFDATLQRQVALKEYMPSALASRSTRGPEVSVKSPRFKDTFDAGLRSFVNEARLLAHFDHPALVKVHQFWQGNRTAYMVMPFYEGPTLKDHVRMLVAHDRPPNEATLRSWIDPLLDALALMHAERCFHRDIAPDNILLTPRGPLLLDFGAARKVISDMTQALTVILKPGYAPIEQYGEAATMVQGPWTDLYALASVVYFCITGRSPITSVERMMGDPLPLLARQSAGHYGDAFLQAIDAALAVRPIDRPQSVDELRGLLNGSLPPRRQVPRGLLQTAAGVEPAVVPDAAVARSAVQVAPTQHVHRPTQPAAPPPAHATAAPPPRVVTAAPAPIVAAAAVPAIAPAPAANRKVAAAAPWIASAVAVAALAVAFWAVLHTRGGSVAPAPLPQAGPAPVPAAGPAVPAVAAVPTKPGPPPASAAAVPFALPPAPARGEPPPVRTAKPQPAPKPAPAPAQFPEHVARPPAPAPVPAPVPAPAPAPAVRSAEATLPAAAPAAKATPARPARCGELFEKGNQGTLTIEEANFLRQSCR